MATPARTLEDRLKFDCGLTIGAHAVRMTHDGHERIVLVRIPSRGHVRVRYRPTPHSSRVNCYVLKGDSMTFEGSTVAPGFEALLQNPTAQITV